MPSREDISSFVHGVAYTAGMGCCGALLARSEFNLVSVACAGALGWGVFAVKDSKALQRKGALLNGAMAGALCTAFAMGLANAPTEPVLEPVHSARAAVVVVPAPRPCKVPCGITEPQKP